MTPRFNRFLLAVLLLLGLPYYWLLLDNRAGDIPPKPVTIEQLRTLASSLPGPAPSEVRVELVGWRRLPGTLFAAGSGLKRRAIGIMSFQLPVPGGRAIVIDSGITAPLAKSIELEGYRAERQMQVEAALDQAGLILVTHEHPDHLGALAAHGGTALGSAAWLNPAQLPSAPLAASLPWRQRQGLVARIAAGGPQAVAPGVVVIPAPSHTPGSQMIYVRLGNGREYLFAGDISTLGVGWQELRARSRLVSQWLVPEDRSETYAWLKTIRALKATAPGLKVIPGHDYKWIVTRKNQTNVIIGFSLTVR